MDDLNRINAQAASFYAFLFTDIEGSTLRWARFPAGMGAALARHDAVLREVVGQAGGAVFKTTGDGGYAVFSTAVAAIEAAAALQIRMGEEDFGAIGGIKLRAGVHCGPASFRDGDYYGLVLSRTARIMAAGHGGQVLVSAPAAGAARAAAAGFSLRSLGAHRLKDLGQAEEIFQLVAPGLPAEFPALTAMDARPNNLPSQTSALIGREAELAELRGLLAGHKLVTLLGPGGIGKSRLALQAAADALDDFADGVFLVELAGVSEAGQVPPTAAAALNITLGGGDAAEQLACALRGAAMLIVLDNCEHLIEAVSALAGAVLRRNAGITILATSRSRLGLPGEQSFALPSLAVPDAVALPGITAQAAAGYAGIQLFVARAALVQPGFALHGGNAADIAAICQRLDGIALAIELAAARIRLLRPKELLARLNDRFRLLIGGARTSLPRQQTLKALIDWSFDLLTEAERVAFRRLGVFAGSFDLAGAEAVLPGGPIDTLDVLDLVASLLDKSLVTRLPAQDREARYRLLDSTRHYAVEKMAEAEETSALHRAHARHIVAVLGGARRRYPDTDTVAWRADVEPEVENLQAALAWAFGDDGEADIAIALASRLLPLAREALITRPLFLGFVRAAVQKLAPDPPGEDTAFLWLGLSTDRSTGPQVAAAAAQTAQAMFDALGYKPLAGLAASIATVYLTSLGDVAGAQRSADAARAVLRTCPPDLSVAFILINLAASRSAAAREAADFAAARSDYAAALEICEKFNNLGGMVEVTGDLADIQAALGDYSGAIATTMHNAAQDRTRRDWQSLTYDLVYQSSYCLLDGDEAAAARAAREALPLVAELDDHVVSAALTCNLAVLAARCGALEMAASLAGYTDRFYVSRHVTLPAIPQRVWDALMALFAAAETTGALPAKARARLMEQGAALSLQEVLKLLLPF